MNADDKSPNNKLVLLLIDGLRADTARDTLGYLQALNEAGRARWSNLRCEMPSLSRPLYATVINGLRPLDHGVVSNTQAGVRCGETIFHDLAAQGHSTAIAAYHWFFELLAGEVFQPLLHRHAVPASLSPSLRGAAWYWEDDYPDSHLLADAEHLRRTHGPDLLFIHPMGCDHAGHQHGGESAAYNYTARKMDMGLALLIPLWQAAGYDVLLTSDHGMNADRMHGGVQEVERDVPLVWLPHGTSARDEAARWPVLPTTQLGLREFVLQHLRG